MLTSELVRKLWIFALVAEYLKNTHWLCAVGVRATVVALRWANHLGNTQSQRDERQKEEKWQPVKFCRRRHRRLVYRRFRRHTKIRSERWRDGNGEGQ